MKKVFVDPKTIVTNTDETTGYRLCEIIESGTEHEIAEPYFWADLNIPDLSDGEIQSLYYYDPLDSTIKAKPVIVVPEKTIDELLDELLLTDPNATPATDPVVDPNATPAV